MIHMHVTTWFLTLLLFVVSYVMLVQGKEKAQKITHMILRLFSLLVLATGGLMLSLYQFASQAVVKSIFGIAVLFFIEFILVRGKKGKPVSLFWGLFAVSLALVLYYGYVVLG